MRSDKRYFTGAAVRAGVMAALVVAAAGRPAGGEEPLEAGAPPSVASLLPETTLQLLLFDDISTSLDTIRETSIYKLWQEPEVKSFLDPILAKLGENIDELETTIGDFKIADIRDAFRGQVALAVVDLVMSADEALAMPQPEVAFLAEVTDRAAVERLIERAGRASVEMGGPALQTWAFGPWAFGRLAMEGNELELGYVLSDNALVLVLGPEGKLLKQIAAATSGQGDGPTLADDPDFLEAIARAGQQRDMFLYVNTTRLATKALEIVRRLSGPASATMVHDAYEALGLDAVRSISAVDDVEGKGVRSSIFVHAPQPRKGIFELLPEEPLRPAMLAVAPETTQCLVSLRLRLDTVLPLVRAVGKIIRPDVLEQLEERLALSRDMAGIDIERDVIGGLGLEWSLFFMPSDVFGPVGEVAGVALVARVKDAQAFERPYNALMALASIYAATRGQQILEKEAADGTTVKYTTAPLGLSPAVALSKTHLVISPSSGVADAVLQILMGQQERPAVETDDYRRALALTQGAPEFFVAYQRPLKSDDIAPPLAMAPAATPTLLKQSNNRHLPRSVREVIKVIDLAKVPSADTLTKHAVAQIAVGWSDEKGIGLSAWSPFGITGGIALGAGVGAAAGAPVLAREHEAAERARCTERMQAVVDALLAYAKAHDNAFAPTLKDLVPAYLADESLLRCPSSDAEYTYVSGLNAKDPASMILMHGQEGNHGLGCNVATANGRVMWRSNARWVDRQVVRQVERLRAQGRKVDIMRSGQAAPNQQDVEEFF
jgi:hypothetical protein